MKKRTRNNLRKRWTELSRLIARKPRTYDNAHYQRPLTLKEQQAMDSRILRQMLINFQL